MKRIIILLFSLITLNMMSDNLNDNPLIKLEGTWYVNMSNFKMWLKGNKHNPRFTYTLQTKHNTKGLKDVVSYTKHKKQKEIIGFDTPADDTATSFIWRGKGFLSLFKSKWKILYQTNTWTIIHFEKTAFTAEGFDVISRQKSFDKATLDVIRLKLAELGIKDDLQIIEQI